MRPDLAAGAAARGPGRGGAAAGRASAHAGRGVRSDPRWLTRPTGQWTPESEVASGMTPVPFTDLAAMASEVWPEIEPDYLACLLGRKVHRRSSGHVLRARVGRLLRRRSCGRRRQRNGRPAAQPDRARHRRRRRGGRPGEHVHRHRRRRGAGGCHSPLRRCQRRHAADDAAILSPKRSRRGRVRSSSCTCSGRCRTWPACSPWPARRE